MNAVATKPRSQAKPKASKSVFQLRMSTINNALEVFDDQALHGAWRLLSIAHSRLDAAVFKASQAARAAVAA